MKKLLWLLTFLIFTLIGCQQVSIVPTTGDYETGMKSYDRAFIKLIKKWQIPGGALAVFKDGEVLLSRGYGYANVEQKEPVLPDSLFRIASVSKPVTAIAILELVEEGKLALDMQVFSILNDIEPPDGKTIDPRIYEITIQNLLEHSGGWDTSSGLFPMSMTVEIAQEMGIPSPADCPDIIRYMLGQPLDFDPGSQYAYSNYGYCVLGQVVEKVSGQTYEDYVRNNILIPMGIERMYLGSSQLSERNKDEVHYYDYEGAPNMSSIFPENPGLTSRPYGSFYLEAMAANGGWIASAADLAKFVYAVDPENSSALLKSDTLEAMLAHPAPPLWEGQSDYYALGWRVRSSGKSAYWWHTGSMPGTTAILYRASSGMIWAALFNTQPDTPGDEFLVDVISAMGQAAVIDKIIWGSLIGMAVLISTGILLITPIWRRSKKA